MQKYPIGIQNFQELITGGYLYVDKTALIYRLVSRGKYYFLSRPRRFGKSLLVSTLQALYEGKKELFEGLYIGDKWDFSQTNPTLVIYFNQMSLRDVGLEQSLITTLRNEARRHELVLESEGVGFMFQELIEKLHIKTGRKVVVLVDEYDKPIVDYLEELPIAHQNRQLLKSFYGILKPSDEHLEFVLLTGVSKFAKVSVFSDLNNLNDISLDDDYANLVGISQPELEASFEEEISVLAAKQEITREAFLEKVKAWYNGYSWNGTDRVYNPFSLLNFFSKRGAFQNYWFSTGTPTWLIGLLRKQGIYQIEGQEVSEISLDTFDIERLEVYPILFQTGYLTIRSGEDGIYVLDYPNQEVKQSFLQYLLQSYRQGSLGEGLPLVVHLRNALQNNDLAKAMEVIDTVFSSLPYDLWQNENERFYHALIHLTFTLLGVYVQSEVHTSRGRCDALVQTQRYVYAFEFKLDKTSSEALEQVKTKGYLAPYKSLGKELVAVGVNFSTATKSVESWDVAVLN
ncbi:ATP-binding protein [Runella sp. SP2]|uniref:ATP-binding protein n=1 Tax=Runella sp. SP2 TaxID=2268026 RepID=UPI000F091600|nr:ATP-binding protein [Runella sp. SP2]AYQ30890.1 AAA family ATPase [Runella sp. SP2]